jgi:hypothetical protein
MIDFQDLDVLADLISFGSLNIPYRKCLLKTYLTMYMITTRED